jgi:ATP-binding cassette subfamily F protein uup
MALIQLRGIHLSFGSAPVLNDTSFSIERGERVGLLGRNGAGKTTLLRMIEGVLLPEQGVVERADALRVARLIQEIPSDDSASVWELVAGAFGSAGRDAAAMRAGGDATGDPSAAWAVAPAVETAIARLGLDPDQPFATLSGGLKRRAALARALATDPDILLLDEPTNHLDVEAIEQLETLLLRESQRGLLFVTHDRAFLERIANRIVELDRGKLTSWDCGYRTYLERRERQLLEEEAVGIRLDKRIAEEAEWASKGVAARRTKSVGRLRALEQLRAVRASQRKRPGELKMAIQEAANSGKLVCETQALSFGYEGRPPLIHELTTFIMRGDRIGIIGPNGCGKTTLIRCLLGELEATSGQVRTGTRLEVVYFDQTREWLDPDRSVVDTVADGNDRVTVDGRTRHVHGYLQDFLFSSERARVPVRLLSGGERARLLLARLFLKPSNVLVLDEPTNDLDTETLELLEQLLSNYPGTVLVVSHDRAFLNEVVTSTLVFEGDGRIGDYPGGYDDWLRQRPEPATKQSEKKALIAAGKLPAPKVQMSFKEKKELEELPRRIEVLEQEQSKLSALLADPVFYAKPARETRPTMDRVTAIEAELAKMYARWEALEARANPV